MDRIDIETLLEEAHALANHAFRIGRLPANSRLFEEIDAMTQARRRGEDPPLAPLVSEMQKVSKAAHITVEELAQRDRLGGRLSQRAALATPYLVGLMTLLLTLYLAFQSSELHKADLALREYQVLESERLQEKIYHAWKLYRYERVLNVKGPALAQLDGYQQLVDDAKRLYEKRSAVQELLLDSSVIRYLPDFLDISLPVSWAPSGGEMPAVAASEPRPAASTAELLAGQIPGLIKPLALDCSKEPDAPLPPPLSDQQTLFGNKAELDNYRRSIACFVQSLQIAVDYDYPMISMIYATRNKMNLLVSWMLPGLYGLLGACVFLMRDLLRGNGVDRIHGGGRIVDLLSLLLRVALGGLAGIIIGWFWVPTSAGPASSAISVSSISFGAAFLAGFSIDSLFALLDRLIKNFQQTDEDKSAEAARKAEGKA